MKKLLLLTHVNPFSGQSGQAQRVRYTLQALQQHFNVHLVYGTYAEKEKQHFLNDGVKNSFSGTASVITSRRHFGHYLGALFSEYFIGLKSSNYFIARLFGYRHLQHHVRLSDYDVVFFEYWHAYKTAQLIRRYHPNITTICDTHNILSATYSLYVNAHPVKKLFPTWFKKRYSHVEFRVALPSFQYIVAINLAEYDTLVHAFNSETVWYCPMGVDLSLFAQAAPYAPNKPFVVLYYGGLGSQHNQQAAVEVYKTFVEPAVNQGLNVKYKIVGSNPPAHFVQQFNSDVVSVIGYCSSLTDAFAGVSLAIIPWKGKYGFRSRLIELSACGIPIFTSADAVWGMGYTHQTNAYIFDSMDADAYKFFTGLYQNSDDLLAVSKAASRFVNEQYAYENTYLAFSQKLQQQIAAAPH
ncbi:MAG: glycosyltransferase family 1 protein [Bacteroidetes bacterium]|nr:MAG: glycosyltransferase family 1 protein [Bacteroidota bacterium]